MKSFKHLSPRKVRKAFKELRLYVSSLTIQRSNLVRICDDLISLNHLKDDKIKNLIFKLKISFILSSIGFILGLLGLCLHYFVVY